MSKRKILLIGLNPNCVHGTAIYYLKAFAETNEIIKENILLQTRVYDSLIPEQSNGIDIIVNRLLDEGAEVIAFSCYCWNIDIILKISKIIKKVNNRIKILLGGPEVTGTSEFYLMNNEYIDYIIAGEGEIAFKEFLLFWLGEIKTISDVHNLVYRDDKNVIHFNNITFLENINDIPSIYKNEYLNVNNIGNSFYSYETKRGCQYSCQYCFHHGGHHEIREFDINRVKKELLTILNSSLKYVWIIDPCFNENEERAIEILKFIEVNNKNKIEFGFELRNETLSEKIICQLSKLGTIKFIAVGLQTLNLKSLSEIGRTYNKLKFEDNMSLIQKYFKSSESIHIDLIYGLPGTTIQDYLEAIDYSISLGAVVFTQALKILPGTVLRDRVEELNIEFSPFAPYEVISNETLSYEDMLAIKCINVGLNLFQASKVIRKWICEIKKSEECEYSEVFRKIGEYLWKNGKDQFFYNYVQFDLNYLYCEIAMAIFYLYRKKVAIPTNYMINKKINLDWGCVANLVDYDEMMESNKYK